MSRLFTLRRGRDDGGGRRGGGGGRRSREGRSFLGLEVSKVDETVQGGADDGDEGAKGIERREGSDKNDDAEEDGEDILDAAGNGDGERRGRARKHKVAVVEKEGHDTVDDEGDEDTR